MAQTSIRWACISRILDLARVQPTFAGVTVEATWPGDAAGPERVYVGDLTGTLTVPAFVGPARAMYDDQFTITWAIEVVANGRSPDETMARCVEMIAGLQDVVAGDAGLGDLDGVLHAVMSEQRGPLGMEFPGVGLVAVAQLDIDVTARLAS